MISACRIAVLILLCNLSIPLKALAQTQTTREPDTKLSATVILDPVVKKIVETIEEQVAPVKGYTAEIETQSLDPNGGFDKFHDAQTVRLPDRMLVKRKVLVAHNADAEGQDITMAVDGTWLLSIIHNDHTSYPREPSYSKTNLKAVEKAGGPSISEFISMMGNIVDPFRAYRLDTLSLVKETQNAWVLLAEYKQKGTPWAKNMLTFDKATGFLMEIEAIIPELEDQPVVLFKVTQVTPTNRVENSIFNIDFPAGDSENGPFIMDDTFMWIESLKASQTQAE